MTLRKILRAAGLLGLPALGVPLAFAGGVSTYTTRAAFDSAVSSGYGPLNLANFDSIASGTTISNGDSVGGGVSLSYAPIGGPTFSMDVVSGLGTTSSPNYLGAFDSSLGSQGEFDAFTNGDQLTLTFDAPEQAVGLYLITAGFNFASDFTLTTSLGAANNSADLDSFTSDGGSVYFLGLVDSTPGETFTSATLTSIVTDDSGGAPPGAFLFNVDDIVSTTGSTTTNSVPDSTSTLALVFGAAAGLLILSRWKRCTS